MKFGIFDQNDRSGLPLADQYQERIELVRLYDRLGFHAYHMSEHHATPLSTTPSQSVLAASLIQNTSRLRFCPLVYLLPLHHPFRLAEEICMLDHLSKGRFEFGVGRGASPYELAALGVQAADVQDRYIEAFDILQLYFKSDVLNFEGRHWRFDNAPVEMKPLQLPHPPIWYALASPQSTVWPAAQGMNIVCGGAVANIGAITEAFRAQWHKTHSSSRPDPLIGVNRYIVVGKTEEDARRVGRKAWPTFYENFIKLWRQHGGTPTNAKLSPDFDELVATGHAVAGSADAVTEQLDRQVSEGGLNYIIGSFVFGSMAHQQAVESIQRFAEDVMPAFNANESLQV